MLISLPLFAESYSGTKDDPYPLEVFWKKDGDKMAVFCKSKNMGEAQITDFIFDTDCKESFGKGKMSISLMQALTMVLSAGLSL